VFNPIHAVHPPCPVGLSRDASNGMIIQQRRTLEDPFKSFNRIHTTVHR
jgi:hypothetical protein